MDQCFWEGTVPVTPARRLTRRFFEWKERSEDFRIEYQKYHTGDHISRGERSYSSPRLSCDFHRPVPSLRILLPPQNILFKIAGGGEAVYWLVKCGDTHWQIDVPLGQQTVTGYLTEETNLVLEGDTIFSRFQIDLMCGSQRIRSFRIPADCVRFFRRNGEYLPPHSLPEGEVYSLTLFNDQVVSEAATNSERRGSYTLTSFDFQVGDIARLPDGEFVSVGKKPVEGLRPRNRISGAYALRDDRKIPIYKKPPSVFVRMLPARSAGTAVVVNGNRHRFFDGFTTDLKLHDRSGDRGYLFSLADYGCEQDGIYTVFIDVPNDQTRRYWEFALIHEFGFKFENAPYIFSPRGMLRILGHLNLIPGSDSRKVPGENAFYFQIGVRADDIEFTAPTESAQIPVRINIPAFKWKFDDGPWQIDRPPVLWHGDLPIHVYIKYPAESIRISMEDPPQSVLFHKIKTTNQFECDMTRFRSWLGRDRESRKVYVVFENGKTEFMTLITRSSVRSCILVGDFEKGVLIGKFDISGKADYCADLYIGDRLIAEKVPIRDGKLQLSMRIESDKYRIVVFEYEPDETGFGGGVRSQIAQFEQDLINPFNLTGKSFALRCIKESRGDVLGKPLRVQYIVKNLRPCDESDTQRYIGWICVKGQRGRVYYLDDVIVCFTPSSPLNQCQISLIDELELLYDENTNHLVAEENMLLHWSERYRRYTPIYRDDFLYEIQFQN
jgi:hypothetical protein